VYSVQNYVLYRTTEADAREQVNLGNADELKSSGEYAIQLKELNRRDDASPSGIPASTVRAYATGATWAVEKVHAWGEMQRANIAALVVTA